MRLSKKRTGQLKRKKVYLLLSWAAAMIVQKNFIHLLQVHYPNPSFKLWFYDHLSLYGIIVTNLMFNKLFFGHISLLLVMGFSWSRSSSFILQNEKSLNVDGFSIFLIKPWSIRAPGTLLEFYVLDILYS